MSAAESDILDDLIGDIGTEAEPEEDAPEVVEDAAETVEDLADEVLGDAGVAGGLLGETPVAALVAGVGWRHTSYIFAGVALMLAVLIFLFMGNAKQITKKEPA